MSAIRNVLLITFDQWRFDAQSNVFGSLVETPNVVRLAARGVRFDNHVTVTAPCGPSRASLLTGLYANTHRAVRNGTPLSSRFTTLPKEMRAAGMVPILFGYTDTTPDPMGLDPHDPALTSYEGVMDGFELGQVLHEDGRDWLAFLRRHGIDVPGPGYAIYEAMDRPQAGRRVPDGPCRVPAALTETAFLTDRVLEFLSTPPQEPFLAHVSYLRPHPPFTAPSTFQDLVDPASIPLPRPAPDRLHPLHEFFHESVGLGSCFTGAQGLVSDLGEADIRRLRANYLALVLEVDHHLGRILDLLEDSGRADETLIILTSDHGEMLGDEGLFGKLGWWQESYRIPLVIAGAGVSDDRHGSTVDLPTESIDVLPTLLALLERPIPRQCEGRPLTRLLMGESPEDWRVAQRMSYDFRDPINSVAETRFGMSSDACQILIRRAADWTYSAMPGHPPVLYPTHTASREASPDDPMALRVQAAEALLSHLMQTGDREFINLQATSAGLVEGRFARKAP